MTRVSPGAAPTRPVTDEPTASVLLSGVDALVRLLTVREQLDERAGLCTATMVSGYPGSPLGTFDLALGGRGQVPGALRIRHQPGLNEELAVATVWGSQMGQVMGYSGVDGVAGVWYGKTPGLDRSGDALKHGNSMGSGPNGGVVLFCGDDPTAKSSTLACDSQHTFEDACIPVLYPADQQDVIDLGVHAFRMSRYAGCWVGLKVVTSVADGIGTVDLSLGRLRPEDPLEAVIDGRPWRHQPLATVGAHAVADQEILVVHRRLAAARAYARHNGLDVVTGAGPGAPIGVVCSGQTYLDVMEALALLGHPAGRLEAAGVRLLKLGMTYPVVEQTLLDFAASVGLLMVVEEKRPFVETQIRSLLHEAGCPTPVVGKRDAEGAPLVPAAGELDGPTIAALLTRIRSELGPSPAPPTEGKPAVLEPAARAPGFCSGCPHNRSTVFPDGALVGGGVGCHGIMYFEARHQGMKSLPPTPMGAEGVPWIGLAPFVAEPHLIQNLGDGTLSHSGSLAIRACVAAGVDVTFKVLYNAAVAMTGGQDVTGLMDVPSLTRALEAEGVTRIVVCAEDPRHYGRRARWAPGVEVVGRDRLPEVQERLRRESGVSVIVYDQRCAAEARRLRRKGMLPEPPRRVLINEAVCEGCGDCSTKSNCLSVLPVETEFGEKRRIHDPSCNRDYTCLEGDCPSFVTLTPSRRGRGRRPGRPAAAARPDRPAPPPGELPEPPRADTGRRYGIYFTGIGGTGVVTANRVLAAAAEAAGLAVGGMDQTGLSQKAGAVVSHLHLAPDRADLGSPGVTDGGADLYLSGDILQAASGKHLGKVDPGRTIAVVDRDFTPTAAMLQSATAAPDVGRLEEAIVGVVGAHRTAFVDSKGIAEALLGNHMLANIVILGAAYQMGGLPLSFEQVDAGMRAVRESETGELRAAFEWGRWAVAHPETVRRHLTAGAPNEGRAGAPFDPSPAAQATAHRLLGDRRLPTGIHHLLERRTAQVIDYQDTPLARRYLDLVETAASRDSDERGWELTRAVAEAWFKLLTYKDEYEVARLHRATDYQEAARRLGIEGGYTIRYHLHPPTLRRIGLEHKLPLGRTYQAAFAVLSRMKRLRGTRLDPFGLDPDRKAERALISEYEDLVRTAAAGMPDYDRLVRLAASALGIKGFGPVKEAAVERWRREVQEILGGASTPA